MGDPDKKPWYTQLPAKLAAAVVFLVALTTLAGNVMELIEKRRQPAVTATKTESSPAPRLPPVASESQPARVRLQVDRIIVHVDGSPGTTDWRFSVEADDTPLFVFGQDALTDQAGRNVATPEQAGGILPRSDGKPIRLSVRGWRGSRLRLPGSEPDVGGDVTVVPRGVLPPVIVQGDSDDAGSFEFHFSTTKVE